ncbi:unnamed protein product [Cuscuta campestris]|uniref:C3H1-type domain-containing protein n=2 Tax=Cuscuta sect. Cleistogrammica TaxID=1824901 RepID=A0A484K4S4_9ASTE|nr:hypothetical protein DM860_008765 [Cuscuta australis]VFQ58704.1 unnamed protein product [Cuscuta campestris]
MLYNHGSNSYSSGTARYSASAAAELASQTSWSGPPGVDIGPGAADPFISGLKRPSSEALYRQAVFGGHSTIGQTESWFSSNPLTKRPRFDSACNLPIYPQRPGEKDCAHYMLTRTCKFGDSCMFDHPIWVPEGGIPDWKEIPITNEPLPERPGEPDCPYFLKTQKCKYGIRCRFNHPKDKGLGNTDALALPERPSEPICAFYMKTGQCKFGATCKYHHPKDIQIQNSQENGSTAHTGLFGMFGDAKSSANPAMLHNSKGLPIRPGEVDCPFYLKTGSCKYGATCRYNHPAVYAINAAAAALGHAFVGSPASHLNPTASLFQFDPRVAQTMLGLTTGIYPQRPGQLECDFYMKTGVCKFGERCRYHHPIDRSSPGASTTTEAHQQSVKLSLAGLPRREGAIHCPYYMKTGTCKYGTTCKFDHPPPGEVMTGTSLGEEE